MTRIIDGGRALTLATRITVATTNYPRTVVKLPPNAPAESPRDLTLTEVAILKAAHRGHGGITLGHATTTLTPGGWTEASRDMATAALDRLVARGLLAPTPRRDFVFTLTTSGKALAEALTAQECRADIPLRKRRGAAVSGAATGNRDRGRSTLTASLPRHPACGSAPGGSRS